MFSDEDLLMISGLQHLCFCERQWVLIHMEQEWNENVLTIEGRHLHDAVHEQGVESRGDVRLVRGLRLRSLELGLYGVADMVEFHKDDKGVRLPNLPQYAKWLPYPVEYKRGRKRYDLADEVQVCAQSMCLEEMLKVSIPQAAIYYGQPRRRSVIELSADLRGEVKRLCDRARTLYDGADRPRYTAGPYCRSCSVCDICMPDLSKQDSSSKYLTSIIQDITGGEARS